MKLYLHINYFERTESLERAFAIAREIGADGLELRRIPVPFHAPAGEAYLGHLARLWEKYPVEAIAFGAPGPNLAHPDRSRREKELEAACAFYEEAARRLPVKVINLLLGEMINPDPAIPHTRFSKQGSALATPEHWEWATEGGRVLAALGQREGIPFAVETHGIYLHDSVEAAARLVEAVAAPGHFGILWDHSNEYLFDTPPSMDASFTRCRPALLYVHLKNLFTYPDGGYRISSLSEGRIDIRRQLQLLNASRFDGPIAIESPREGDRIRFLREDMAYLMELVSDLGLREPHTEYAIHA